MPGTARKPGSLESIRQIDARSLRRRISLPARGARPTPSSSSQLYRPSLFSLLIESRVKPRAHCRRVKQTRPVILQRFCPVLFSRAELPRRRPVGSSAAVNLFPREKARRRCDERALKSSFQNLPRCNVFLHQKHRCRFIERLKKNSLAASKYQVQGTIGTILATYTK